MSKIKKFTNFSIRKITGGKDPDKLVTEFIESLGFNAKESLDEVTQDYKRWSFTVDPKLDLELEVILDNLKKPSEGSIYFGLNLILVPLRGSFDIITIALEIADGLMGTKLSLVDHHLVLSTSFPASSVSKEELEFEYKNLTVQHAWFLNTLGEALSGEHGDQDGGWDGGGSAA